TPVLFVDGARELAAAVKEVDVRKLEVGVEVGADVGRPDARPENHLAARTEEAVDALEDRLELLRRHVLEHRGAEDQVHGRRPDSSPHWSRVFSGSSGSAPPPARFGGAGFVGGAGSGASGRRSSAVSTGSRSSRRS